MKILKYLYMDKSFVFFKKMWEKVCLSVFVVFLLVISLFVFPHFFFFKFVKKI